MAKPRHPLRQMILPILAVIGALIALLVVFWSQRPRPKAPLPYPVASSPYSNAVYGSGIIEASTENIAVGTPFILPITKMFVVEGDCVKAGDPLFQLDTRALEAQKVAANAQVKVAQVNADNATTQFSFYDRLQNKRAVSEQAYMQAYYAMLEAAAQVDVAKASLFEVETDIERALVRAPVDGQILQVNVHVGEVYPPESYDFTQPYVNLETAFVLMGTVSPLQMRIDIDEEDAWRYVPGSRATAFVRGNACIHFPMEFCRIEPYVIPKVSLTGEVIERIDTRVLQVLYRFEKGDLPVYPGQLLDVYIETPHAPQAAPWAP